MSTSRTKRYLICFLFLAALTLGLGFLNLVVGSTRIGAGALFRALFSGDKSDSAARIVWSIRLPRLLAAAILGGALSVSGFLLQTFFANPIAGPFVLGISSGAKLTVALAMIACLSRGVNMNAWGMVGAAFVGSLFAMGFILLAAGRTRGMARLIVCGVMIGYICSAITDFVVTFADDSHIVNLHYWSMGSFSGVAWAELGTAALVVFAALVGCVFLAKPMGAYQLGEAYAASMGVNIRRFRLALIGLASLLAACVTAFAGPVSFVGIAVPQLMKGLYKTARPLVMIPACFFGGASFCLGCDLIARTLFAPTELAIGSVTALFGAPVVIWILLRRGREGGA